MAARRRSVHSARRLTAWEEGPGEYVTPGQVITGSDTQLLDTGQTPVVSGLTTVRLRGFASLTMTSAVAVGAGYTGCLGIGICTATAFAAGVTATPTPITNIEDENWLWMQEFGMAAQSVGVDGPLAVLNFEIDSKAMRKFDDGMVIYAAYEVEATGSSVIQLTLRTRMLVKLP